MNLTIGQQKDLESIKYFVPFFYKDKIITEKDEGDFLAYSERGIEPKQKTEGYNLLLEGKKWRGIHAHEMYEDGILEGTVPYYELLGGLNKETMPSSVVDFLRREMFNSEDSELIMNTYRQILNEKAKKNTMFFFYKSERVGKAGKVFHLYKFRTLKENTDKTSSFAQPEQYTKLGHFLRKTKLDELPSLLNVLKGDIGIFGYRAEETRTFEIFPDYMKKELLKHKPGLMDLASIHFADEERLMQMGDPQAIYWKRILPMKHALRVFYFQNQSFILNIAILWIVLKKIVKAFFRK